jgi:hypothetical protein
LGTWSAKIFDDDLAMDVREAFDNALSDGLNASRATRKVIEQYELELEDHDDGAVIYLALASLQLEHNALEHPIKAATLSIIKSGQGLERWEESGLEALTERKRILEELRMKLSPQ